MKVSILLLALVFIIALHACNEQTKKPVPDTGAKDSAAACEEETVKDPNEVKPMAMMMRTMAMNADSMRAEILRGTAPDSLKYPFIRFHLVEPTDPDVLQPHFYQNARFFQLAYKEMFRHPGEAKKYYNVMIGKCVNCHESYCSGPLKRIRKLYLHSK